MYVHYLYRMPPFESYLPTYPVFFLSKPPLLYLNNTAFMDIAVGVECKLCSLVAMYVPYGR
jgi:hypothetical protein